MTEARRKELRKELQRVDDELDALYWAFSRQARAKPPACVRPDLYRRRAELHAELGLKIDRPRPV